VFTEERTESVVTELGPFYPRRGLGEYSNIGEPGSPGNAYRMYHVDGQGVRRR